MFGVKWCPYLKELGHSCILGFPSWGTTSYLTRFNTSVLSQQQTSVLSQQQTSVLSQQQTSVLSQQKTSVPSQQHIVRASETSQGPDTCNRDGSRQPYSNSSNRPHPPRQNRGAVRMGIAVWRVTEKPEKIKWQWGRYVR